ncbi:MAG TPA: N-acetyl-gamma-glutamyl-phosphate reductase [Terriglobia bacterium]|nr:N-acetyl-gamma-glutamyl-phosphate reductase [Terriglobia bacterium]
MDTAIETNASLGAGADSPAHAVVHAAVIGATGYAGCELLTLLARHPAASVTCLMSSGGDGKKAFAIEQSHPKLRGRFSVLCEPLDVEQIVTSGSDVVFLATPHETSHQVVPRLLEGGLRVVDLSGAFRLKDPAAYKYWYGFDHSAADALAEAVYGIPEFDAPAIAKARLVANPGCYPTSVILALAPLLKAGCVDVAAGIIADSKSGATGAGRKPSDKLHFPEVNENLRAYGLFHHRHLPEMLQELALASRDFVFTPHLLPITRGILTTIYLHLSHLRNLSEVETLFRSFYATAPMVRIYPAGTMPEILGVASTQYADIGFALDEPTGRLILVSTIDNLGKGAAGQAVQNMNVMFGFPQETGLL